MDRRDFSTSILGKSQPSPYDTQDCLAPDDQSGAGSAVDLYELNPLMLVDAFNALAAGVFFVDSCRRVLHANACGRLMLAKGHPVRRFGSRLSTSDPGAEQLLRDALDATNTGAATPYGRMTVPLFMGRVERYAAHVLPLRGIRSASAHRRESAAAAVFVQKATLCEAATLQDISRWFKLTPAELRVLAAIVEVGSVPEAARRLGLSEATVKTHLQRLFEKTGVNRQVDLVKLLAAFISPIGSTLSQ